MKDGEDQDYIGNGAPKFEMNMTNTFSWKGFTFMFDLQWVYGNKLINFTRQLMGKPCDILQCLCGHSGERLDAGKPKHDGA